MADYRDSVASADTLLLLLMLQCLLLQLDELQLRLVELLYQYDKEEQRQTRFNPLPKAARSSWEAFSDMIPDDLFRRMFRMTKENFAKLCAFFG